MQGFFPIDVSLVSLVSSALEKGCVYALFMH